MDLNKNTSDLLPAYVNNTLDEAARRRVENILQSSPALQAEVAWLRQLREQIQNDKSQHPALDAGLDRLMGLIAAEKSGKVTSISSRAKTVAAWYKPALAIAATVVLAQAIGLFTLLSNGPGADGIKTLSGSAISQPGTVLQVTFKSTATETQMRASLAAIDGEIISGPGALGVYHVRVKKGSEASAISKLMQRKSVIDTATELQN